MLGSILYLAGVAAVLVSLASFQTQKLDEDGQAAPKNAFPIMATMAVFWPIVLVVFSAVALFVFITDPKSRRL